MAKLDQLVADVKDYIDSATSSTDPKEFDNDALVMDAAANIGISLHRSLSARMPREPLDDKVIYASGYGKPCHRQQWYAARPSKFSAPALGATTKIKFAYGDLIEEYILFLAQAAGHTVEKQQELVEVPLNDGWRLRGRIDAVIDGELVDVKSASTYSYKRIAEGGLTQAGGDPFGYLAQLGAYTYDHTLIPNARASFLVMDKTLGSIALAPYPVSDLPDPVTLGNEVVDSITSPTPPPRKFADLKDGVKGNRKLGTECSYCAFKHHCWPRVRTFLYSTGPRYLTRVTFVPNVLEVRDA